MINKTPLVSICCAAYNHEAYIEDALRGFLMQECDFEYEILIHDDASTDKTAEIIKRYEMQYPEKIFPIYQTENQYSQGKKFSDLNYERVRGKYVAICEGDDYWTNSKKLQRQVDAIENNPKHNLCFHPAIMINCKTNFEQIIARYSNKDDLISIEDIILKKYGIMPTASLLMTKTILDEALEYRKDRPYLTVGDLYFQIFGSYTTGTALYINEIMSVYRYLTPYSWTMNQKNSTSKMVNHVNVMDRTYKELNEMTEYKYSVCFQSSMILRVFHLLGYSGIERMPELFYKYEKIIKSFLENLNMNTDTYIIYGSGSGCRLIMNYLLPNKIEFIVDKDESRDGLILNDKKIYSLSKLQNKRNCKIIISLIGREDEPLNVLKDFNISNTDIISFDKMLINAELI